MKLVMLNCIEDVIIYGRNENGEPDKCFIKGKDYLFCFDEKKQDIFIVNEVNQVHFMGLNEYFTDKHFTVKKVDVIENFGLDDVSIQRFQRLFKERHSFDE